MTHETHRCSVEGCPSLAAYEVMLYGFDLEEGAIRFTRDESCAFLCVEHAIENEREASGDRGVSGLVSYPHTNRGRLPGVSVYLDLRSADVA
jgi:hypothetical protein